MTFAVAMVHAESILESNGFSRARLILSAPEFFCQTLVQVRVAIAQDELLGLTNPEFEAVWMKLEGLKNMYLKEEYWDRFAAHYWESLGC